MPSLFDLIPGSKRKKLKISLPNFDKDGNLSGTTILELDASISETHSSTINISENTIEDGSIISDHIDLQPKELKIDGLVSNTPLGIREIIIGNTAGIVGGILGRSSNNSLVGALAVGGLSTIGQKIANLRVNDKNLAQTKFQQLQ